HPDWVLGVPGRTPPLGRGQYVLDLIRPEVADNIFGQLDKLLSDHPIAYLKWDMNRDLTHPASAGRPASHRQTRAVYALIDRLRAAHPTVEIESCASGGGRADYEILKRTDRIWTSDCNDPFERQSIQAGFALFFPPEVMGAHVGPAASHTTARTSSLDFRTMTALFGHMGIEADIRRFSPADLALLGARLALHKQWRPLLHSGRSLRQTHPDPGAIGRLMVSADAALASYAQLETPAYATLANLKLNGLPPETEFEVRLLNVSPRPTAAMKHILALARGEPIRATGQMLRTIGLPLPVLRAGEIAVFLLEPVPAQP
ncbi:MAG: alpha-galactosidase, partial [Pseudomonadota bacterium]|nr:alpha-galactosidase [Pseudomonadota bacterium]